MNSYHPNLFIVGAPKAGTTFLHNKLFKHPDIYFSEIKELNYFSLPDLKDSYYRDYKTLTKSRYLNHYKKAEGFKYIVDGSVSYFSSIHAIKNIKNFNEDARIIISIRNPIERSFSHFQMDKRMGYAENDFDYYLRNKDTFHYHQYVENSLYFKYISLYINYFGRDKVHVVTLENLEEDLIKLFSDLNLNQDYLKRIDFKEKINMNKGASNFIGKFFLKNRGFATKLKLIIPEKLISIAKPMIYKSVEKSSLKPKSHKFLRKLLIDDIKNLERLLDKSLIDLWQV